MCFLRHSLGFRPKRPAPLPHFRTRGRGHLELLNVHLHACRLISTLLAESLSHVDHQGATHLCMRWHSAACPHCMHTAEERTSNAARHMSKRATWGSRVRTYLRSSYLSLMNAAFCWRGDVGFGLALCVPIGSGTNLQATIKEVLPYTNAQTRCQNTESTEERWRVPAVTPHEVWGHGVV